MSEKQPDSLPTGWATTTLGEILTVLRGVTYKKEEASSIEGVGLIPILRATNIYQQLNFHDLVYVPSKCVSQLQLLRTGDVIIAASSGSKSVVGKAAPLRHDWNGSFGAFCYGLRPNQSVHPLLLANFLRTTEYRNRVSELASGVNINNLRQNHIEETIFRLPPLVEQQRIVEEIETQFSRLDAGVAALKRVQANLKRYRAAVLRAACEGRLVPAEAELARQQCRDYESADVLLKRILAERRARWEAEQLAKLEAQGRLPLDNAWKAKYQEPAAPDTSGLPKLSEGWCWTTLLSIADIKGGITKGQQRRPHDVLRNVPYLRVANVQRGLIDLTETKYIEATESEINQLRLQPGDILFNEGGDRDKLGRGWIWNGQLSECIHQNHVFRARLFLTCVQPKYISWYGNTIGVKYFVEQGKQTTNLASINMTKLAALPIPLPPSIEQERIVEEVERRLSIVDELEATVTANLKRAERLRQAVLQRAFAGKLVPQDPKDEPAAVLLERIRAERSREKPGVENSRQQKTSVLRTREAVKGESRP